MSQANDYALMQCLTELEWSVGQLIPLEAFCFLLAYECLSFFAWIQLFDKKIFCIISRVLILAGNSIQQKPTNLQEFDPCVLNELF